MLRSVSRKYSSVSSMESFKRVNPSAERNRDPILSVLNRVLPKEKPLNCLEIASGSGTHVGYFAERLSCVTWQPSDCDQEQLRCHVYPQQRLNWFSRIHRPKLTLINQIKLCLFGTIEPAHCTMTRLLLVSCKLNNLSCIHSLKTQLKCAEKLL